MSYILDGLTLPRPVKFTRVPIETGATVETLSGATKRDITNKKEMYILEFRALTQAEATGIVGKYNLNTTLDFEVTETNLTIAATECQVDISARQYVTGGSDYREDLTLTLMEVQ